MTYLPAVVGVLVMTGLLVPVVLQFQQAVNPWQVVGALVPLLVFIPMLGLGLLRRSRPESLTLGADHFRHDLGRPGGFWASMDRYRNYGIDNRPLWRRFLGLLLVVELPKAELGEVVIERVTGQLRLRYDVGADRIEIGRFLREPEKEWLAEVIREWQKAPKAFDEAVAGWAAEPT
jgi:hypothetical protein